MTLAKKMVYGVLSLLILVFIGAYLISLTSERNYFVQQAKSNAKSTAATLGFFFSQALIDKDKTKLSLTLDRVFNQGSFALIEVRDSSGSLLAARYLPKQTNKIPPWFIRLVQLPPAIDSFIMKNGDKQLGEVFVSSDSNYAYRALWHNSLLLISWYLLFTLLSLFIAYSFIKWLLKPLKRMTEQANEIYAHKFPIETSIPKTPELRSVTLAMNQMVVRIKQLFEEQLQRMEALRRQSFQDALTGLGNRRYFLQQITSLLTNQEEFCPGFMVSILIEGLDQLNKEQGFQQGDKIIDEVANLCIKFWPSIETIKLAKISDSGFALLIKENNPSEFVKQCNEFNQRLQGLFYNNTLCKVFVAAIAYQLHQTPEELFNEADIVLKKAAHDLSRLAFSDNLHLSQISIDADMIRAAISEHRLSFCLQWVVGSRKKFHREVFARINDGENQIRAGSFMPIAENAAIAHLIDQFILSKIIANNDLNHAILALNLSKETVVNPDFQAGYIEKLKKLSIRERNNLYIELNEAVVLKNFAKMMVFVKTLRDLSIKVGVDQVGIHFSPLHYLNELPINYLKLHGSLIQDIADNQIKQFFIHYLHEMSKILNIQLIATQVETEKQWQALQKLGLKWGQGHYLSAVESK